MYTTRSTHWSTSFKEGTNPLFLHSVGTLSSFNILRFKTNKESWLKLNRNFYLTTFNLKVSWSSGLASMFYNGRYSGSLRRKIINSSKTQQHTGAPTQNTRQTENNKIHLTDENERKHTQSWAKNVGFRQCSSLICVRLTAETYFKSFLHQNIIISSSP